MTAVRNVLFVMCDQLRRDHVSCYGSSRVPTPNIDRLAKLGVRFDHAFSPAPLTLPCSAGSGSLGSPLLCSGSGYA